MYRQALVLSDGHLEKFDLRQLSPNWLPTQLINGSLNSDCTALGTDSFSTWLKVMANIDEEYKDEEYKIDPPNYLRGVGGPAAIQRMIDSTDSTIGAPYIYHTKAFTGRTAALRKFPPFDLELKRKGVQQAVSVTIIYHSIDIAVNHSLCKAAYFVIGWDAWNKSGGSLKPTKQAEFPRPLIHLGEGALIGYLSGHNLKEELYDYHHWFDKAKDHFRAVCSFVFIFWYVMYADS